MSDLPRSATEASHPDNTSQWLKNLEVDFDSVNEQPPTPCSSQVDEISTPALPHGIEESEGTATPHRFAPETGRRARTISEDTYDSIRKFVYSIL